MSNENPEICFDCTKKNIEPYTDNRFWQAYTVAYEKRFPYLKNIDERPQKQAVVSPEAPVEEGVFDDPETATVKYRTKKNKKNPTAIALVLAISLLSCVLCVMSYLKFHVGYTTLFVDLGITDIYELTMGVIALSYTNLLTHAFVACFLLALFCLVMNLVLSIVALAIKKKVSGMGVFGLLAFISLIASAVLMFFVSGVKTELPAIVDFINPLNHQGVQFGMYICLALALVGMICGFCTYRKQKVAVE